MVMVVVALVGAANLVAQGKAARPTSVAVVDVQQVFNTLDDNRSGRVNVRELVGALGEVCARNTHPLANSMILL